MTNNDREFSSAAIRRVIGRLVEEMYFREGSWLEANECGQRQLPDDTAGAVIAFAGARAGELRVAANRRLAQEFAADFTAADPGDTGDDQSEALMLEFANVACGALLADWMPESDFRLTIPRALGADIMPQMWEHRFSLGTKGSLLAVELTLT